MYVPDPKMDENFHINHPKVDDYFTTCKIIRFGMINTDPNDYHPLLDVSYHPFLDEI
jgi:hypothetical protein